MIKIKPVSITDKEKHEYYSSIISKRSDRHISRIDKLCHEHLLRSFEEVVWMDPDEIDAYIKRNHWSIPGDFFSICSNEEKENNYLVKTVYREMPDSARNFIFQKSCLHVCPYCNRNYIDVFEGEAGVGKGTFDLDHYYPASKYPMFAVSFYNLIPVCGICNRKKRDMDIGLYPYGKWNQKEIRFRYILLGTDYLNNTRSIDISMSMPEAVPAEWKEYIRGVYDNHKEDIQMLLKKRRYYGRGYQKAIKKSFQLDISEEEIKRMLFGRFLYEGSDYKYPLSKFLKDIYEQYTF